MSQELPAKSQGSNWVETVEGEIIPSYTGPNAPKYPNASIGEKLAALEEDHAEISGRGHEASTAQMHLNFARASLEAAKQRMEPLPDDPTAIDPADRMTRRYFENRRRDQR